MHRYLKNCCCFDRNLMFYQEIPGTYNAGITVSMFIEENVS
jgi:hypothetical protein